MFKRVLQRLFARDASAPQQQGVAPPAPSMAPAPDPVVETIHHRGFDIPRNLAWRTGLLANFTEISDAHIGHLQHYADLENARDIVEIGCGVGRDAIALIPILPPEGRYLGIDIMAPSIAWAQSNITPRDPRFEFVHFDVCDAQHNPGGTTDMAPHRIPRNADSTDLIFLFSVFTHMFPADIAQYLDDFHRVLRRNGRVFTSMFFVDDALRARLLKTGSAAGRVLTFQHEIEPGFFHNDPAVVPGATAYTRERFTRDVSRAGFEIETLHNGNWSGKRKATVNGQDIVVLKKR